MAAKKYEYVRVKVLSPEGKPTTMSVEPARWSRWLERSELSASELGKRLLELSNGRDPKVALCVPWSKYLCDRLEASLAKH